MYKAVARQLLANIWLSRWRGDWGASCRQNPFGSLARPQEVKKAGTAILMYSLSWGNPPIPNSTAFRFQPPNDQ